MDNETQPIDDSLTAAVPVNITAETGELYMQFDSDEPKALATAIKGEFQFCIQRGNDMTFTNGDGKTFKLFVK